ncbi:MAG: methylenetetrahydrofolate--tRNA-(uracil(54)-C(5))-methyltransferase (FADH(2)-oxidizing) TrmFO [Solobacterium sp.]|nr:methylenetetrahydrofolate--tRNA-(uracil(54)-C(5))-methyltransferase (FADH(2)-oxidizing) TrmFO [Solobacterium sp.]
MIVTVVGAGLAGCEAAWQLARRGIRVRLVEMKPKKKSPAHVSDQFAELVCSNSLRSNALNNACGLLKEEMRFLDSLIMAKADEHQVPAGSALAVDRHKFSDAVTQVIRTHPLIEVVEEEQKKIPDGPVIVATGPLTSDDLMNSVKELLQEQYCYFYDAEAPIVTADSIDFTKAYWKSRYDKGTADYVNCPMNKEEFESFYDAVINADTVPIKAFEKEVYFEGCMPFEVMAKRGRQTLLFGPMKPVGLEKDGKRPYAVVQLRKEDAVASAFNLVGFQTHLTWPAQKEIIHMIPGLEHAEIIRYGVMHRNSYINSPQCLNESYQCRLRGDLFFAGQITGVEGYVESTASGLLAGINMARYLKGQKMFCPGPYTMIGAMSYYVSHASAENFQPMNANFGIMNLKENVKKKERKDAYAPQSLAILKEMKEEYEL